MFAKGTNQTMVWAMNADERRLQQLVERLADRLCHDISSSGQALASGMDLLREAKSEAERGEATALLTDALASQRAKVSYARRAFGSAAGAIAAGELEALTAGLYADIRPTLDWAVDPSTVGPAASRALLILLQIAADALAAGGVARATAEARGDLLVVAVEATGPRVAVREEVRSGLAGEPYTAGLAGRWAPAAFVAMLAASVGGTIVVEPCDGGVRFALSSPPGA